MRGIGLDLVVGNDGVISFEEMNSITAISTDHIVEGHWVLIRRGTEKRVILGILNADSIKTIAEGVGAGGIGADEVTAQEIMLRGCGDQHTVVRIA